MGFSVLIRIVLLPVRGSLEDARGAASKQGGVEGMSHTHYLPTRTASNNTFPPLFRSQTSHEIERSSNFEAENLLQVFSFQPDLIAEFCTEVRSMNQWRFFENVINLRSKDKS